jgi:hypothetical protein
MATPTFPTTLPEPSTDSYSFKPVNGLVRTEMDSGYARVRRRFTQTPTEIEVNFKFTLTQLGIFEKFFEQDLLGGASWFYINLYNGTGKSQYIARFKTGTYSVQTSVREFLWDVSGSL